jgi:hypothetical protein
MTSERFIWLLLAVIGVLLLLGLGGGLFQKVVGIINGL